MKNSIILGYDGGFLHVFKTNYKKSRLIKLISVLYEEEKSSENLSKGVMIMLLKKIRSIFYRKNILRKHVLKLLTHLSSTDGNFVVTRIAI